MDPIFPWLDPLEVRRLADRLMAPAQDPSVAVSDAGFDAAFVGYAAVRPPPTPTLSTSTSTSASASPPAVVPAAQPPPVSVPTPPEPVFQAVQESGTSTARGPFLDRIHRFRDWMRHHFAASGIFILDREGAVIFDENNHGRLHFLARSLAHASRRPGSSTGNVHVKIGAGATLEVIPVETTYGCLVLGAVVPEALTPAAISAVMEALTQVASPPGSV
jgi:hypothetical protein